MAPKKKKTKEEIAAEKAKKEEEARLAEEERARQEVEAKKVAEQLEHTRQQLLQEYKAAESALIQNERQESLQYWHTLQQERQVAAQDHAAQTDWQRYLSCSQLPDPHCRMQMNDYFNTLTQTSNGQLAQDLEECEGCINLACQCLMLADNQAMTADTTAAVANLVTGACANNLDASADVSMFAGKAQEATVACSTRAEQHRADARLLFEHIDRKLDASAARVLQYSDLYADDRGDVLVEAEKGPLQLGLWVNTHKNPRFKQISFKGLQVSIEVPKQIALANVALRLQRRTHTGWHGPKLGRSDCNNCSSDGTAISTSTGLPQAAAACCFTPLGGTIQVDLLALPPVAKESKGWTVRQVTPLSYGVSVVPYPIPPAGADLSTWQPDEEPPPLNFNITLAHNLLVPANLRVGWWDERNEAWSQEGVSDISYDAATRRLSFSSRHLGCLALLQDTTAALPYSSWTIWPTGGLGGAKATINIKVEGLLSPEAIGDSSPCSTDVSIEVGRGTLTLLAPALPQLTHILGSPLPPCHLFAACEACGLRLRPGSAEARVAGLQEKEPGTEGAMCAELALLCGNFLVASSRWNRAAGSTAVLCRLSEVTDWEEGGRTGVEHAARIFKREVTQGERRVLIVRRQGLEGVMFVEGADRNAEPPQLCDFSTAEGVLAARGNPYCQMHHDLLHLLARSHAEDAHNARAQAIGARADCLEKVRTADSVFTLTMQQALQALRLLTFS